MLAVIAKIVLPPLAEVLLLCKTIIRAGKTVESVHLDSAPLFYRPALGLLG